MAQVGLPVTLHSHPACAENQNFLDYTQFQGHLTKLCWRHEKGRRQQGYYPSRHTQVTLCSPKLEPIFLPHKHT